MGGRWAGEDGWGELGLGGLVEVAGKKEVPPGMAVSVCFGISSLHHCIILHSEKSIVIVRANDPRARKDPLHHPHPLYNPIKSLLRAQYTFVTYMPVNNRPTRLCPPTHLTRQCLMSCMLRKGLTRLE